MTGQSCAQLCNQLGETVEYDSELAKVAAVTINKLNGIQHSATLHGLSFLETHSLKKARKKFPGVWILLQRRNGNCLMPLDEANYKEQWLVEAMLNWIMSYRSKLVCWASIVDRYFESFLLCAVMHMCI